jgi:hypothetical protein
VKLNTIRFDGYIAQASAKGITVIAVAHKDDVFTGEGNNRIKVGEKPSLRKNAEHTFDVILRFFKEKDIVSGQWKFLVEVEKDTTKTYPIGTKLEGATYDLFKGYIEQNNQQEEIKTSYDTVIESNVQSMQEEQADHEELVKEFKALYKDLLTKNPAHKDTVTNMMKEKDVVKYNDTAKTAQLKELIEDMKKL